MVDVLDSKIENVLDSADRMFIATSVGGNSSGASVFFSRDGEDLVFFTFHPTRKAEQIRLNPRVHVVIWPKGQEGIEGLQIDGECYKIKDEDEPFRPWNIQGHNVTQHLNVCDANSLERTVQAFPTCTRADA